MLSGKFKVPTHSHMELIDITSTIQKNIVDSGVSNGICYIFNPHTTAGLTINEGADPSVQEDIIAGMRKIVPLSYPYKHLEENSPSHIMASLIGCTLTVFIENGLLVLGTWQKIFFCEFDGPRTRTAQWRILPTERP
jgi:secondary thiamine-phosphate synthase enzyme